MLYDFEVNASTKVEGVFYNVRCMRTAEPCNDNDRDAHRDPANSICTYPGEDCDDFRLDVNPAATEICNGIDDNCDGRIDEGCGYSAAANAEASTYGSASLIWSRVFNELALLLFPVGAVIILRILRRKRYEY